LCADSRTDSRVPEARLAPDIRATEGRERRATMPLTTSPTRFTAGSISFASAASTRGQSGRKNSR
jgi:hypothetical protein